jgi:PAS domain-containing protein
MQMNLAFRQTMNERLLVLSEVAGDEGTEGDRFSASRFLEENDFLERLIAAGLGPAETNELVAAVLLAMQGSTPSPWVTIDLDAAQRNALGLDPREGRSSTPPQLTEELFAAIGDQGMNQVLLRSPTPFSIALGEEFRIAFMNDSYAHILGKEHASALVGKTLLTALPELRGSACVQSLEQVYRTGEPRNGI